VLTADLVHARRRGTELHLVRLAEDARLRAVALAERLIAALTASLGATHEDLAAALEAVDVEARDYRLKNGFVKLLFDRC
jgi:predicted nuclease of restriction endonuclease-like RecB superfamily